MPFTVKDWQYGPAGGTPVNPASLEDLETRLSTYVDEQLSGQTLESDSIVSDVTAGTTSLHTGLEIVVNTPGPFDIVLSGPRMVDSNALAFATIYEGFTQIGSSWAGTQSAPCSRTVPRDAAAGDRIFTVKLGSFAGLATLTADTDDPCILQAVAR